MGQVPPYPYDPDLNENLTHKQKKEAEERFATEYPEQAIF